MRRLFACGFSFLISEWKNDLWISSPGLRRRGTFNIIALGLRKWLKKKCSSVLSVLVRCFNSRCLLNCLIIISPHKWITLFSSISLLSLVLYCTFCPPFYLNVMLSSSSKIIHLELLMGLRLMSCGHGQMTENIINVLMIIVWNSTI